MRTVISDRLAHWRVVLASPALRYLWTAPTFLLGIYSLLRDEFLPTELAEKLKLPKLLSDHLPTWLLHVPWYAWALVTLSVLIVLVLEGSYRVQQKGRAEKGLSASPKELADMPIQDLFFYR